MIQNGSELLAFGEGLFGHYFLVFLRLGALVSLLPAFGEQSIPMRVKLGIAAALTFAVGAALPTYDLLGQGLLNGLIRLALIETANGLVLGIALRLFVLALQTAGSIAAQSTSLSQVFGGAGAEPMPAIGHILVISGLTLAVILGLHIRVVSFAIQSYQVLPVGEMVGADLLSRWGVGRISAAFQLAFSLAAPFVIASVLYNLTLGAINRAMPQLMVAFVGAPVITFGGIFLLFMLAPLILQTWHQDLISFMENPFGGSR